MKAGQTTRWHKEYTYRIVNNVPPPPRTFPTYQEAVDAMHVGESIFLPTAELKCSACRHGDKLGGWHLFTSRKEGTGYRVWRIA
jgi:hypothetical protein